MIITFELNDSLPRLFDIPNYVVPEWDAKYDHVWYLDPAFTSSPDRIWVWHVPSQGPCAGTKDMGSVAPRCARVLDVVFISYHESNAEENWQRVLQKAPNAKRVDGVAGILNAHRAAAELAETDMFFVVDGDAYLVDEFDFTFSPDIFNRNSAYVYRSINPINRLSYGYGGVKVLPKQQVMYSDTNNVDITSSVASGLIPIDQVSNITAFNTDSFITWRSAFRECAKLAAAIIENSIGSDNAFRLRSWQTFGQEQPYGADAIAGAKLGEEYGRTHRDDPEKLKLINDRAWLKEIYDQQFKQ